tara:strand:- start:282 stop:1364 length:1083 start_codon:yes stop_codon:yes gene_type:complete
MFPTRRITLGGDVFRDEYSLSFDGTNDKLVTTVPSSTFHGDFSFSTWVKRGETGSAGEIADGFAADNDGFKLFFRSSDDLRFSVDDTDVTTSASFTNTGRWYHVVAVQNDTSNTQQLYIDGVLDASGSGDVNLDNTNNVLEIGDTLLGNISDIAIYNTPLTASQVRTIYNGREPYNHKEGVASSNLVSWWRMGDGALDDKNGLIGDETNVTKSSQIIADGNFDTAVGESTTGTYWITQAGWTIGSGSATYDGGGDSNTQLESVTNANLIDGAVHQVNFTLTDTDGGGVYVRICGGSFFLVTGTGAKTVYLLAGTSTNRLTFETGHDDKAFTIDNVSVYKVNGNAGIMTNMSADDFTGDTP